MAFKFRGAFNALSCLSPEQRRAGVVAYSSGNHAQAVALSAQLLGLSATLAMPHDASPAKLAATRGYGATVVGYDRYTEDAMAIAKTLAEREAGSTEAVVKRQLSAVIHALAHCAGEMVVAYEPVWAIGTGKTATPEQAQEVHAVLRSQLRAATPRADAMTLLYGGSVKPDNASSLFAQADIDGALVGGAALKAADFVAICRAAG